MRNTKVKSWVFWAMSMLAALCWMTGLGYVAVLIFVDRTISTNVMLVSLSAAIVLSLVIQHYFFILPARRDAANLAARFEKFRDPA